MRQNLRSTLQKQINKELAISKWIVVILACVLLLSFAACGEEQRLVSVESKNEKVTESQDSQVHGSDIVEIDTEEPPFGFSAYGIVLIPGHVFDASLLPEANSVYAVPNCALDTMDNLYAYDDFELTAYSDGGHEIICSIWLSNPNLATDEGLTFGDGIDRVTQIYGSDREETDTSIVYTRGDTQLSLLMQDGIVVDIQYLWLNK